MIRQQSVKERELLDGHWTSALC